MDPSRHPSVRQYENMNIPETSGPIAFTFCLCGGGKAVWVWGKIGAELWVPWQQIVLIESEWEECCGHSSVFIFYLIFILAGNEFEIWPDPITDCGVSCP